MPSSTIDRLTTASLPRSVWAWRPMAAVLAIMLLSACSDDSRPPLPVEGRFSVVENLDYADYDGRILRLDLYIPDEPVSQPVPVVIAVRGGGFRRGDKEAFAPIAGAMADRGIAAASIEYRTSAEALFPGAIHDTKAAVRWLRQHAADYGLDASAIGAIGGSAGGYLSAYLGVTTGEQALEGSGGSPEVASSIQAIVAMAPEAEPTSQPWWGEFLDDADDPDETLRAYASTLTQLDAGEEPPLLLIHSADDNTVPLSQSQKLSDAYDQSGNQVDIVVLSGAPHAFWYEVAWFPGAMDRAAAFFAAELGAGNPTAH